MLVMLVISKQYVARSIQPTSNVHSNCCRYSQSFVDLLAPFNPSIYVCTPVTLLINISLFEKATPVLKMGLFDIEKEANSVKYGLHY